MKTVGCTITLKSDANLSCVIDLTLDDKGRRTWRLIDSPRRRLQLNSRSGSWRFHSEDPPTLLLRNDATGLFVAALVRIPRDFWTRWTAVRRASAAASVDPRDRVRHLPRLRLNRPPRLLARWGRMRARLQGGIATGRLEQAEIEPSGQPSRSHELSVRGAVGGVHPAVPSGGLGGRWHIFIFKDP
jgi:hypothetical protein